MRSPSARSGAPGAGEHGAAAGDDRGALGAGQQVGQRGHGRLRPGAAARSAGPSAGGAGAVGALLRLHVEREHEHDRRGARRARGARARATSAMRAWPARGRARRSAPTASTSPSWSMRKFERTAARGHLRREHDQRRAALGRLGQAGQRVRQPRPLVDAARARARPLTRALAVGHADRAALVAGGVKRAPASRSALVTARLPLPMSPNTVSTPSAARARGRPPQRPASGRRSAWDIAATMQSDSARGGEHGRGS